MGGKQQTPNNLFQYELSRYDSLFIKNSTSYYYVANASSKQLAALLRVMHNFDIQIHMILRIVPLPYFKRNDVIVKVVYFYYLMWFRVRIHPPYPCVS